MPTKKIIYFIAGIQPTTAEQAAIDKLNAVNIHAYDVKVFNGKANPNYGYGKRACDYVAGTVPTAYNGIPVLNPNSIPPQTVTKSVIFFTADTQATDAENVLIEKLNTARIRPFITQVMSALFKATYGDGRIAPSDYVAGSVPAAFTGVPTVNPDALPGTDPVPATAVTLAGPTTAVAGSPSSVFTASLSPNGGTLSGSAVVTPSSNGGGGTFSPTSVSLTQASPLATFTYTPASAGNKTISVSNNASLTNPASIVLVASAAPGGGTVEITSFPYTLQASDSGKTLNMATVAESVVNIPASLGATFSCNMVQTGDYPVQFVEAGAAVSNSGYRISNLNNLANSLILGKNKTATLTASAADVLALSGQVGRWQAVASGSGWNDSNTGGNLQIWARTLCEVKGQQGDAIVGLKFVFVNGYGQTELGSTSGASFAGSVGWPLGAAMQSLTFAGQSFSAPVTVAGAEVISDYLILTTPVPIDNANPNFLDVGAWNNTVSGGAFSGKGSARSAGITDVNKKEFFGATTTGGTTTLDRLTLTRSSLNDTAIANSSQLSPSTFAPAAIIGVTTTGAEIILIDSRAQPSNGDTPTIGGSPYAGEGERLFGRQNKPMLNLACANAGLTTLMQTGAARRKLMRFGTTAKHNGIQNDLGKGTIAAIRAELAKLKADPYMVGKPISGVSSGAFVNSSNPDCFTTIAGQTAANVAQCQLLQAWNAAGVAGQIVEYDKFYDIRPFTEVNVSADLNVYKVAANGRSVTDGVFNAASPFFDSASAAFTNADTGKKITITGWVSAGAAITAKMTYVSPTRVSLTGVRSFAVYNATLSATGATAYIQSFEYTVDGTHKSQFAGEQDEANFVLS